MTQNRTFRGVGVCEGAGEILKVLRRINTSTAIIVLVCFFLPCVQVSCAGAKNTMSGLDLARDGQSLLWFIPVLRCAGSIRNHPDQKRRKSRLCTSERYVRSANRVSDESRTAACAPRVRSYYLSTYRLVLAWLHFDTASCRLWNSNAVKETAGALAPKKDR